MHILVVPDKFKGTLSSAEAAQAIAAGWREARPADELELVPMSDGGDGFGEVMATLLDDVQVCRNETVDAAHRPCAAEWWLAEGGRVALIESARVVGLALLPARVYHPFQLDTFGLGGSLRVACTPGRRCIIGIGGSATNDGGFGMARALGWKFTNRKGMEITEWTGLTELARVSEPAQSLPGEIVVAVDVQNPLLGPTGASRVYGPQKGLRREDFPHAEACLSRLAAVMNQELGTDVAGEPGTGAAGGLGFGLRAFAKARLESGFSLFARSARLEERIGESDLVLTGEGSIDESTLMGKGVGEIARLSEKHGVSCVGLAGVASVRRLGRAPGPFTDVFSIVPELTSLEISQRQPALWLTRLAEQAAVSLRIKSD